MWNNISSLFAGLIVNKFVVAADKIAGVSIRLLVQRVASNHYQ